jgi:hypothetical protein
MRCPHCGSENSEGSKFCIECGSSLTPRCPGCGADNVARAKFCAECGTPLTGQPPAAPPVSLQPPHRYTPQHLAQKILTSKSALEGERQQVTVLFADLKASMELPADRDPEEARAMLDPVLQRMMEAVHRYEGTVNQALGDSIMALFGAPLAHEDHAVREGPELALWLIIMRERRSACQPRCSATSVWDRGFHGDSSCTRAPGRG